MTERELIVAVRSGDRQAFNLLYERYWANLVSYASLIAGEKSAMDIVHDVFLKVWLNRASLQEKDSLRPYLMRSIYNMSINVLRNAANLDFLDSYTDNQISFRVAGELNPDTSDMVKKLYDQDTELQINNAIEQLPDRCREIFRRSYLEGQSHKDIASDLGIALSTVDNQIYKALKILRSLLSEELFLLIFYILIR